MMEMDIGFSITDVTEIDSQREQEHISSNNSDISKDIPNCDNKEEIRKRKDEEHVEENLKNVWNTAMSSSDIDCSHEKLQIKETPDNNYLNSGIGLSKCIENKLRTNNTYVNENNDNINKEKLSKRFLDLVDSDSEEESNNYKTLGDKSIITNMKHLCKSAEHVQVEKHTKTFRNKNFGRIESESDDDLQTNNTDDFPETIQETVDTNAKKCQIPIDSKSKGKKKETAHKSDAFDHSNVSENKNAEDVRKMTEKSVKKRKGSVRASKNEAMRQIHSETQRLLREAKISLPYHRPKQRTLQEFLNRKKIILPKAPSMVAKMKMCSAIVNQLVIEREKEAELFYKSSDSEDEMQLVSKDSTSKDTKNVLIKNKNMSPVIESLSIQDHKNIENKQNSSIKKKITQQDQLDIDTSNIFHKDFCAINHQDKISLPMENSSNRDDESDLILQQTSVENNRDFHKSNVSRKLFDSNYKNTMSKVCDIRSNKQETTDKEEIIKIAITTLDKKKYINEKKQNINEMHDDKNIMEDLQRDDCMTNNITLVTSSDITQIGNNEKQNNCVKINETSQSPILISDIPSKSQIDTSAEKYQASDDHVLGLPLPPFINGSATDKNELLPKFVPNSKVTLKGLPGTIIDLTQDVKPNKKGINTLLNRFFNKHINTKRQIDDKSKVTVIHLQDTQNGPVPIKEILPYKLSNINNSELNKPGAKLKRLKEDLELQMTLKRNELWQQKNIEEQAEEKKEWDEEEESDNDLDKQKETDILESTDSEESEPEENDVCLKDKRKRKCLFVDDEAEVTDECSNISTEETDNESSNKYINIRHRRDNASEVETDEEEEHEDLNTDMEDESESKSQDTDNTNISKNIIKNKDRKTKQLMEKFQDISDIHLNDLEDKSKDQIKNIITDVNMSKKCSEDSGSISESECDIPFYQQNMEVCTKSQIYKTPLVKTSMLDFVSPITQLSILNTTLDSNKKNSSEKNKYLDKHESLSMESVQNDGFFEHTSNIRNKTSKKRLFDDIAETIDDEYLMKLCSGKFESMQTTNLNLKTPSSQFDVTESQLPELCSRNLDAKSDNIKQWKNPEAENKVSQNMKLILSEDFNKSTNYEEKEKEVSVADSKLKLTIASSDDDDQSDDTDTFFKPKKRSTKKLILTDSEDEQEEEEKDAQSYDEENDNADNENAEQYIDYDSEENEIVSEKNIKKIAADFLEEEAELSESDWDSVDEDEKDLDKLEFEEGDNENIDEHKIKNELGKIHARQMLDKDKREVKLLKELLFEDGDLYTDGTGRERKFKWRNIDKLQDNEMHQTLDENDGWVDVQEDEEEAKWNKFRRERDKFLEERKKCSNNDIEDDLHDSKIFKLGMKALKRIENNKSKEQNVSLNKIDVPENMEPIMPRNITDLLGGSIIGNKSQIMQNIMKKRSFLARGEESLARLASLAKQSDSHMVNTRNFVFQYIEPTTSNTTKEERKTKEEKDQELQKPQKRKNMSSNFSLKMKKRRK